MSKLSPKATAVRAIILANIKLVQNGQDDIVIKMVEDQVGYSKKSDNKRAYNQQKDKVLAEYRNSVAAEAAEPTRNKDGAARKDITERKGRPTYASKARKLISDAVANGTSLLEVCEQLTALKIESYREKGKDVNAHKMSYYVLQARNEIERVAPVVQASLGIPVSTPQELKMSTRRRDWKRKNID